MNIEYHTGNKLEMKKKKPDELNDYGNRFV